MVSSACALGVLFAASSNAQATPARAKATQLKVPSECYWVETGIKVEKGRRYRVEVVDMSEVKDWFLPVRNLRGWPLWAELLYSPLFWTRRQPFEPWFAVIATVNRRCSQRLREGELYIAPTDGQLVCYFNDAFFAYGNNYGTAELRFVPLPGPVAHTTRQKGRMKSAPSAYTPQGRRPHLRD